MNIVLLALIYVVGSVLLSLAGLAIVRRVVGPARLQPHHDVAGFIFAILGVIYAVLLAFVVIVVWEQFEGAGEKVMKEANTIATMYRVAHAFPTPIERKIKGELHEYSEVVISQEWPAMANGGESTRAEEIISELYETMDSVEPSTVHESDVYMEMTAQLNEFSAERRERLLASRDGLPDVLWMVLYFGAFTTIAFTYFFGPENYTAQALMVAMLSATIGMVLFLIAAIDRPFTGDLKVQPEAFHHVVSSMTNIDARDKLNPVTAEREWTLPTKPSHVFATSAHHPSTAPHS